ncbi:MAG: hypothetical protein RLZ86_1820, partial [Actinomycetota bacterium]
GDRLSDAAYRDTAVKFVAASLQGWAYCRDNVQGCADIVVSKGSMLGASHQLWQMNEVNKLIWPATGGAGVIDKAAWDRTAALSQETKNLEGSTVLTAAPDADSYTNDIVNEALAILDGLGVDTKGSGYSPITVELPDRSGFSFGERRRAGFGPPASRLTGASRAGDVRAPLEHGFHRRPVRHTRRRTTHVPLLAARYRCRGAVGVGPSDRCTSVDP